MTDYKTVFQLAKEKGYNPEFSVNIEAINLRSQFSDHYPEYGQFIDLCLMQKWLRDEHKIYVHVSVKKNDEDIFFNGRVERVVADEMRLVRHPRGESYEFALLEGICEALKLL